MTEEQPPVVPESGEVPEGGVAVTPPPPPPIVAPPEPESLAEQVQREAHTVPESTGPSDVVPNRANIRPPTVPEEPVDEDQPVVDDGNAAVPVVTETPVVTTEPVGYDSSWSAADLIAAAQAATTQAELDEIEAAANGRTTVLDAVNARSAEIA